MNKTNKIIMVVLVIISAFLLARFVFFKGSFDKFGEGLENISKWEEGYKKEHPNATDAEVKAAFSESISNLKIWKENYKKDYPNATDTEIDQAFEDQWDNR
ncbi:MAG: hypothetical protein KBC11_02855 [Candidatus Pacebacteria bacterium]|nr:hypothetical protein [Candidatus Paceibacterota bacterium]